MLGILRKAHAINGNGAQATAKKLLLLASSNNCIPSHKRDLSLTSAHKQILKSPYPDVTFTGRNFFELMWSATGKHGDRTALVKSKYLYL